MKKITCIIGSLLILSVFLAGCGQKEIEMGWGTYENGVYENPYFGYSIEIDQSYHYLSPQEIANMDMEEFEQDEDWQNIDVYAIDELEYEPILYYLYAFKNDPSDHTGDVNANISIFSENLAYLSGISNKENYVNAKLDYIQYIFERSDEYSADIQRLQKVWIDDREFAKGVVTITMGDVTIVQEMHVIVRKGHALVTMINYSTEDEKQEMEQFIQSIKISQ